MSNKKQITKLPNGFKVDKHPDRVEVEAILDKATPTNKDVVRLLKYLLQGGKLE